MLPAVPDRQRPKRRGAARALAWYCGGLNNIDQTILDPGQRSRYVLLFIIALHLLALWLWVNRKVTRDVAPAAHFTEVFFPRLTPVPAAPPAPLPRRPRSTAAPSAVEPPHPITLITPPPAPATPRAEPAPPARFTDQVMEQARRDLGKIDRELRKGSLNMAEREPVVYAAKRSSLIAGAYIGHDADRIEETTFADGRRMSKVTRGGKSFCVYKESNGLVGGRDVFRDGVRTMVTSCPR